uniref:Protein kinase domain-containing protein n=1 Tax=Anabas testudineus TaxID=64144 RepID=A0A3Q1IM16_ANATE
MTNKDLRKFCFIGEGAFGRVAHCTTVGTKQPVAVKILKRNIHVDRELQMLTGIKSLDPDKHNVVRFIEAFTSGNYACLAFEKLDRTLSDFIKQHGKLRAEEIRPIARQMLVTLDALKQIDVIHTDIKPDNVMLVDHRQQPFKIRLIDFGVAVLASESNEGAIMQPLFYRSPEVMLGLPVTAAIDMWSLGCLLAFLYTARHLYHGAECEYDVMRLIVHVQGQPSSKLLSAAIKTHQTSDLLKGLRIRSLSDLTVYHPKARSESEYNDTQSFLSLLRQMLHPDFDRRTTPSEALHHAFVRESGKSTSRPNAEVPDATAGSTTSLIPATEVPRLSLTPLIWMNKRVIIISNNTFIMLLLITTQHQDTFTYITDQSTHSRL